MKYFSKLVSMTQMTFGNPTSTDDFRKNPFLEYSHFSRCSFSICSIANVIPPTKYKQKH